jgi:hypothetical protein
MMNQCTNNQADLHLPFEILFPQLFDTMVCEEVNPLFERQLGGANRSAKVHIDF